MKKLITLFSIIVISMCQAAVFDCPVLAIPSDMIIDGNLTEEVWNQSTATGVFSGLGNQNITEQGRAFFFCDDMNLYVGFKFDITDETAKEQELENAMTDIFTGDTAEIMIDAGDTGSISHLGINMLGKIYKKGFTSNPVSIAVQRLKNCWCVEAQIPYDSLELPKMQTFTKNWRINFTRGNPHKKEWSSWALLDNAFHEYTKFNVITGIPAKLDELRKEQLNAQREFLELKLKTRILDSQKKLSVVFDVNTKESIKDYCAKLVIRDRQNNELSTQLIQPVYFENPCEVPVENLPEGRYYLSLILLDSENNEIDQKSCSFWKIPPMLQKPANHFEIRNQCGFLNGEFFFPIIIWQWTYLISNNNEIRASQMAMGGDAYFEMQDAYLKDIKDHGFNTLFCDGGTYVDQDLAKIKNNILSWETFTIAAAEKLGITWEKYVQHAANHGLYMIPMSPYIRREINDDRIDDFINQILYYRDFDNVIAWSMADETDAQVEWNALRGELYHAMDPYRPVWLNVITAVEENADGTDIISNDPYPIPNGVVTYVANSADRLINATKGKPGKSQWQWLQNFGDEGNWTRPPTPEELQQMTTLSLNHGVKGLAYFTYVEPNRRSKGKRQNPAAWEALKTINAHTTELAPMYCLGERLFVGRQGQLDIAVIRYEGSLYVSAVNVTREAISATITLPVVPPQSTADVLYESRTMTADGSVLSDDFAPCAVHVYQFILD